MKSKFFIGICKPEKRYDLVKEAGIEWVRIDVPFPFEAENDVVTNKYLNFRNKVIELKEQGFKIMAITPYAKSIPERGGKPGTEQFYHYYGQVCKYMGNDLGEYIDGWQVTNEQNLEYFRRPLDEDQAIEFMIEGALGLKKSNTSGFIGVNMATGHEASAIRMYKKLYPNHKVNFDYVGVDAYYGSWEAGGVETWKEKLQMVYELTKSPMIIQEFGYSSKGGTATEEELAGITQDELGQLLHKKGKWPYGWDAGHTPLVQAKYIEEVMEIFAGTPEVLGAIWYKWSDDKPCSCGNADCPEGSGYGLVTQDEVPKPAYYAFSKAVKAINHKILL